MDKQLSRRDALKLGGAAIALAATGRAWGETVIEGRYAGQYGAADVGKYVLPPLPYAADALAPLLDAKTLRVHHDKHHAGYVRGANKTLDALDGARKAQDFAKIKSLSRALAFHISGHVLHTLFWHSMAPGGSRPAAELVAVVKRDFGSVDVMAQQFAAAAKKVEGSGWGVLAYEPIGDRLLVLQAEKHQNLAVWGAVPLLVCDVWEHAYYLQYQNRRSDWVDAFMSMANWEFASERYAAATA